MPAPNGASAGDSYATDSSLLQALAPGAMNEGRAAFVSGGQAASGPLIETPEDRNYYSRGR